ncbi:hypothetical protein [Desulfosporosinus shakirovi]|uniref:hypothetical protein n=1 Tax=Desulfosporosinus shakirovi TaxID=2885154 RepID=UPI001E4BA515|nr:hypothetical protein [Desulfosporosinus sp. SRJS8]MCB8815252.1 hypothetical protein [Desulfosporosinus sp. SRJS8]
MAAAKAAPAGMKMGVARGAGSRPHPLTQHSEARLLAWAGLSSADKYSLEIAVSAKMST